jgi:hypothetical protein
MLYQLSYVRVPSNDSTLSAPDRGRFMLRSGDSASPAFGRG